MDLIDIEQARYRYLAQRICDVYWEHNIAHRTDQTEGYPGHHGCRVRLRGRKLELSWYYNSFVPKEGFELIRRLNANLTQLRRTLKSSVCLLAELEAYLEEILAPLARAAKTEGTGKK